MFAQSYQVEFIKIITFCFDWFFVIYIKLKKNVNNILLYNYYYTWVNI